MKITMGYMELAYSLGLAIGPIVASIIYYYFGYIAPFFLVGACMLTCMYFVENLKISEEVNENTSFFEILFNKVYILLFILSYTFLKK